MKLQTVAVIRSDKILCISLQFYRWIFVYCIHCIDHYYYSYFKLFTDCFCNSTVIVISFVLADQAVADTAETTHISSLALLKMLKHGRAGVPMEVMGLMLGEFVDEYTVQVIDVFAMPQSGTGVSVEAVDPVFQTKMLDMLKQTNRPQMVVGWYHSHPGFGCWLSGVDINTQQSFEALNKRAVAVVVDPIQSVKGKVVIDAFRLINPQLMMLGHAPRQTTSNLGHLRKPSIQVNKRS